MSDEPAAKRQIQVYKDLAKQGHGAGAKGTLLLIATIERLEKLLEHAVHYVDACDELSVLIARAARAGPALLAVAIRAALGSEDGITREQCGEPETIVQIGDERHSTTWER